MGRELWVRYPAFELEFRLQDGGSVIEPGQLESFRLGLVNNRLPAIWGGWQHGGLLYKVSVMTVPSPQCGNFDLYKLEVQNPTAEPLPSKLFVAVDGPPDMHIEDGVLRGLGENVFLIADPSVGHKLETRDAGWCDKRAKAYCRDGQAGPPSTPIASASTVCRSSIVSRRRRRRNTSSAWPRRRTSGRLLSRDAAAIRRPGLRIPRRRMRSQDARLLRLDRQASRSAAVCRNSTAPGTSTATAPSR